MPCPRPPLRPLSLTLAAALACNGDSIIAPSSGTLRVSASTIGVPVGAAGYTLQVDTRPAQPLGALSLMEIVPGNHTIQLGGLASNCSVDGENPRAVSVTAGETVAVNFKVLCTATTGSIQVTASTSGDFADVDGYLISIDGQARGTLAINGTKRLDGLNAGGHLVELGGVAANCFVQGTNRRQVELIQGGTAPVAFDVTCVSAPPIAYASAGSIFVVNVDGTGRTNLTPGEVSAYDPAWSPDGSKITFLKGYDLYLMDGDGTNRVRLTQDRLIFGYRWSPDGSSIAYYSEVTFDCGGSHPECTRPQIWVMRSDGSAPKVVAENAYEFSWSPDGHRIAFPSGQLYVVNSDGSGLKRLTDQIVAPGGVAWSPDGDRIAFATFMNEAPLREGPPPRDLFLVNPDGTGLVNLTRGSGDHEGPVWSPKGHKIAFGTYADPEQLDAEIGVIESDGTGETNLTRNPAFDYAPVWSPEGTMILFARNLGYPFGGDTEAYVMRADGGGQVNVSQGPASGWSWRPR
jgi:Tol biopolymer transport system component